MLVPNSTAAHAPPLAADANASLLLLAVSDGVKASTGLDSTTCTKSELVAST